jgi:hypothetical protein
MPQSPQRRKLYLLCDEVGLTRGERIELARVILRRDIVTFDALDEDQVLRMLDALEGYEKISWLLATRDAVSPDPTPPSSAPTDRSAPAPGATASPGRAVGGGEASSSRP